MLPVNGNRLPGVLLFLILLAVTIFTAAGPALSDPFPSTISPPEGVSASPGRDRITLAWSEPVAGYLAATGFSIYRSDDDDTYILLSEVGREVFSFEDIDIPTGRRYHYFIRTDSELGQSANSEKVSSVADNVPPEVKILGPDPGEVLKTDSVLVSYAVREEHSGLAFLEYVLDDDPPIILKDQGPIEIEGLGEGDHLVTVTAEDLAGNRASDSRDLFVDTVPPVARIEEPQNGSVHVKGTIPVHWDAGDQGSGIASVMVSLDGGRWFETDTDLSHRLTVSEGGEHTVSIRVGDLAENFVVDSILFIVDTDIPKVRILSPVPDEIFSGTSVEMEWSGEDLYSELTYSVRADGGQWIGKGSSTFHLFGDLPEGASTLEVAARDGAGQTTVERISIVLDTTPPDPGLEDGEVFVSYRGTVSIDVNASDTGSGLMGLGFRILGEDWEPVPRGGIIELEGMDDGEYPVTVKVVDMAGNQVIRTISAVFDTRVPGVPSVTPRGTLHHIPEYFEITFDAEMEKESILVTSETLDFEVLGSGKEFRLRPKNTMSFGEDHAFLIYGSGRNGMRMERLRIEFTISDIVPITGRVVDTEGRPVEGATVTLDNGRYALTGSDGKFLIEERMGEYEVYVTRTGYHREAGSVRAVPGKENWIGTLRLEKDERSMGKRMVSFLSDPVNLIIASLAILFTIVSAMVLWRLADRDRFEEIEIEMEDDSV